MEQKPVLEIKSLTVSYQKQEIIKDVEFTLGKGEIISIVGESGSGKTTLLRAVNHTLFQGGRITRGSVFLEGEDLTVLRPSDWHMIYGKKLAMIFQNAGKTFDPVRKIGSQFTEVLRSHEHISKEEAFRIETEALKRLNIPDAERILSSYPFQLSGGLKQRTAIAMAMVHDPVVLLADEPTSALDVTTQAQIIRELKNLRAKSGSAILFVTHNMGLAAFLSDRIGVMYRGRLIELGEKEQILKAPREEYTRMLIRAVNDLEQTAG